jgi:hypothetical protein
MRRRTLVSILGLLLVSLILVLLGLVACGGGGSPTSLNSPLGISADSAAGSGDTTNPVDADQPRNILRLSIPELAQLMPGDEFEVTLDSHTIEPLFQASARLLYDPSQLEPLKAEHGRFGQFSVALTRADHSLRMDGQGYVPFAFTGLPDTGGLAPQELRLLTVRFRLQKSISNNAGLRLLNDPAYLQLRGPDNRRLSFDLSEEVAAR